MALKLVMSRIIRDSDVEIEEEAEDLVREFEARLKRRRMGEVVRIEMHASMPDYIRDFIIEGLDADPTDVFSLDGKLGLAQMDQLIPADLPALADAGITQFVVVAGPPADAADAWTAELARCWVAPA